MLGGGPGSESFSKLLCVSGLREGSTVKVQWGSCFEVLAEGVTGRHSWLVRRMQSHPRPGNGTWNF